MRISPPRTALMTVLTIVLLILSLSATTALAKKPDIKMVDTVVGSYTIDGTTVYFVSHITGIIKWIVEPTNYIEWPVGSGQLIPINGELQAVSSTLEHNRLFWDNSRISIRSSSSSYAGTFEVVPTPPEFPGLPPYMPMPKDGLMNVHTLMKVYGELGTTKNHLIVKYVDFVPEMLMQKLLPPPQPRGRVSALLTGTIADYGLDTNENGLYEYLVVSVEVSVRTPGFYTVELFGLLDSSYNSINVGGTNSQYLGRGTHFVDVLLYGPSIYASGYNPSMVRSINLYDEYFNWRGSLDQKPLSREYSFEEFEMPPASLTGVISDRGVDTDGNGAFDYLGIGVEVEVSEAGNYIVDASQLRDIYYNYVNVRDSESSYLDVGTQNVTLTFNGHTIHASGINPSFVAQINLWDEYLNTLDFAQDVPLSKEYSYTEFDAPGAYLTGIITDQGVDTDDPPDGKFDYLEIGVQVSVSEAGTYIVEVDGLLDQEGNFIGAWGSGSAYLDVGTQVVYLQLDGPSIYGQGLNPSRILSLSLYDENYNYLGSISDISLSRTYLYTEFDASP